jgi:adenylate cyclase
MTGLAEKIKKYEEALKESEAVEKQKDILSYLIGIYDGLNGGELVLWKKNLVYLLEKIIAPDLEVARMKVRYKLGKIAFQTGHYNEALSLFRESLESAKTLHLKLETALCLKGIALAYSRTGELQLSQENLVKALQLFEELQNIKEIALTKSVMADVFQYQENYSMALEYSLEALKVFESMKDLFQMSILYNNMGNICMEFGDYTLALDYHAKSLKLCEEADDKEGVGFSINNIGRVFALQGDYEKSIAYQTRYLKISTELNHSGYIANALYNLGKTLMDSGSKEEAMEYLMKSMQLAKEAGEAPLVNCNLNLIGKIYMGQGDYDSALTCFIEGLQLAEKSGIKENLKDALEGLYFVNKQRGDINLALAYFERLIKEKDDLKNSENNRKVASLKFRYELEKKSQEAEAEKKQRQVVEEKNLLIEAERKKSDSLLKNILPEEVAEELKENGRAEARLFENVTVLFTDFKGFTLLSEKLSPHELVNELHECFKGFDEIIGKYNIEKIKTVGDAYLAVSGLPIPNANHAEDVVKAAIEIRDFMLKRKQAAISGSRESFEIRIGIHSGKVVAGIVGVKKFAYDIWGDTVNTAARMEQNSEAGEINISASTYALVKDKFTCSARGKIVAKNKGEMDMYFVNDIFSEQ